MSLTASMLTATLQPVQSTESVTQEVARSQTIKRTAEARQAVFQTTELLENIIVHLLLLDIITTKRVSKQFNNVICGSPSIQQKLFLQPLEKGGQQWEKSTPTMVAVRDLNIKTCTCSIDTGATTHKKRFTPTVLNPLLNQVDQMPLLLPRRTPAHKSRLHKAALHEGEMFAIGKSFRSILTKAASQKDRSNYESWTNMYVTDPPCKSALVCMRLGSDSLRILFEIQRSGGITLGELVARYLAGKRAVLPNGEVMDVAIAMKEDRVQRRWSGRKFEFTVMTIEDYLRGSDGLDALESIILILKGTLCRTGGVKIGSTRIEYRNEHTENPRARSRLRSPEQHRYGLKHNWQPSW